MVFIIMVKGKDSPGRRKRLEISKIIIKLLKQLYSQVSTVSLAIIDIVQVNFSNDYDIILYFQI